ncbi:hypothetical protein L210DRAFT_345936 [Boletus edulis BED1]|uniref:Uncharacterized protein n=1 Tax=Boletus edulis BED1 TaxID=1328754 RepID=A0AAD4GK34_BOLED|nr:hypothetical protein L210DRAFT_345936 [Boletus edulis BED1]
MSQPVGTITPFHDSHQVGLDIADRSVVKPIPKGAVAKWTVQNVDGEKNYYRLYVSDGQKDYALRASEDGTSVYAHESSPRSLDSHVWLIPQLEGKFFGILDPATIRAWKVNGTTIELVEPPVAEDDALDAFKFKFSFGDFEY